jgi:GTPase SAR1 family protein
MSKVSPGIQIGQFLLQASRDIAGIPELEPVCRELQASQLRLQQPMRVALVGLIKAGKSTLMNALLGEDLAATGPVETTFNLNWFCHGETPGLLIHYKDGRPAQPCSLSELAALTRRDPANMARLLTIRHIEVRSINPLLRHFDLIDTPGMASFYRDDAANAERIMGIDGSEEPGQEQTFLQHHAAELDAVTQEQAETADAVIYLFSDGLTRADESNVRRFLGPLLQHASPLTAIGVLSKVDIAWSYESDFQADLLPTGQIDPLKRGRRKALEWTQDGLMQNRFFAIYPVCGQLAFAAQDMQLAEYQLLIKLAALPLGRVEKLVRTPGYVGRDEAELPVGAEQRKELVRRFSSYGVWYACKCLQEGTSTQSQLQSALLASSGVRELREVIISHFGNRAMLIKLEAALNRVRLACTRVRDNLNGPTRFKLDELAMRVARLQRLQPFQEFTVLRRYYQGALQLTPGDVEQLLQITGEHGVSCAERLGVCQDTSLETLIAAARGRVAHWRNLQDDPLDLDGATSEAARLIRQSYEGILFRLEQLRSYLEDPAISGLLSDSALL